MTGESGAAPGPGFEASPAPGTGDGCDPDPQAAKHPKALGGMGHAIGRVQQGEGLSSRGVLDAIGGARGIVEAVVPGLLFLVGFTITRDPRVSAIAPSVFVVLAIIVRLARRENITSAISGALGAAVAVAATLMTGRGEDFYLPGFLTNAAWSLGLLISLVVRWPLFGIVYGFATGQGTAWRQNRPVRRAAFWLTVVWLGMFLARLGVQLPLYFAARSGASAVYTDALGVARLVMGLPLFALVVIVTWVVLSGLHRSSDDSRGDIVETTGEDTPAQ
ncbi:DUF3159 domain-containing protein [Leucobacter sp. HY1908]